MSGFPGFDLAASAAADLRSRIGELTRQAAGGERATSYAGLGADALQAMDLRAELNRRQVVSRGIDLGGNIADATQLVLKQLISTGTDITSRATALVGLSAVDVQSIADTAKGALQEVVSLLGEQYGGAALFGGDDLGNSPVVDPGQIEDTGLYKGIKAQVQSLGGGNAQAVLDATMTLAKSDDPAITPFSEHASAAAQGQVADSRRSVPIGEGVSIAVGLYANRNAAATSSGATTGSWSRDLIRGLSILANLGPDQAAQGADFTTLVKGAVAALQSGVDGVTDEAAILGGVQQRLDSAKTRNQDISDQVELQLGNLENVDMAETITRLQSTQTQLQASYKCLAMLGEISLVNFLN
ncbi:flagellin [Roseicella aquatilis]|uniref:flagellin n=1 Tax=Roseicella aquatilis TaxID=2527868 RepID=UPI00140426AE|nr:flagellin [Roseicella aquatilis]